MSADGEVSVASFELITGINGAGKTLFALQYVEGRRRAEKREVYFWGIRGVKEKGVLPWHEIEPMDESGLALKFSAPEKLHEIPNGSIIVVDEAHAVFPREFKDTHPAIAGIATARWRGHTFILITQSGKQLHPMVRDRIGKHHHLIRGFGAERSVRWEWSSYKDTTSTKAEKEAFKYEFPYPKEVYGWYNSAELHTIKAGYPWKKLRLAAAMLLSLPVLGWFIWNRLNSAAPEEKEQAAEVQGAQEKRAPQALAEVAVPKPKLEGPAWMARLEERALGQPASPMLYDAAYKAVTFPKISGCMLVEMPKRNRCTCNTQQGTILTTISYDQCRFYVKNGWFDPSKPDEAEGGRRMAGSGAGQPSSPLAVEGFTPEVPPAAAPPAS